MPWNSFALLEAMQITTQNLVAIYCIIIGMVIIAWWTFLLRRGLVPELKTSPWTIYLHVAAEVLTALALLVGGIGAVLWSRGSLPLMLSLGMLLYTCVNSAGYYAQSRNLPLVAMFASLALLTTASAIGLFLA